MSDSPLFSIILPIYNVEKYIDRCMNTILNQEFSDYEIILVDDGSTDSCPELCDRYGEFSKKIKVLHKKNGGLSSARNAGLNIHILVGFRRLSTNGNIEAAGRDTIQK